MYNKSVADAVSFSVRLSGQAFSKEENERLHDP